MGSMLCVPLFVDDRMLGTLSFYGEQPDAFREHAEPVARMLATLGRSPWPTRSSGRGSSGRWATAT